MTPQIAAMSANAASAPDGFGAAFVLVGTAVIVLVILVLNAFQK